MTDNQNNQADPQKNSPSRTKPQQKKYPLWKNILAMAVVMVLFVGGGYWASVIYTRHGEEIAVPNLSGLTVEQAEERLGALGLDGEIQDSVYNQSVANGLVCAQSISPGDKVKQGRTVYLTVSSDMADRLTLPDIADNSSYREATARLSALGFTLTAPEYVQGEKDWVYAVKSNGGNIPAGTKVKITNPITLVIGRGYSGQEEETLSPYGDDSLYTDNEILELF